MSDSSLLPVAAAAAPDVIPDYGPDWKVRFPSQKNHTPFLFQMRKYSNMKSNKIIKIYNIKQTKKVSASFRTHFSLKFHSGFKTESFLAFLRFFSLKKSYSHFYFKCVNFFKAVSTPSKINITKKPSVFHFQTI